jgi:hypothetical protein
LSIEEEEDDNNDEEEEDDDEDEEEEEEDGRSRYALGGVGSALVCVEASESMEGEGGS